ncbi:hypothetical protein KIN34_04295 [Cellulomonas sp. DKR-3]|uniref:Uncharacterized protein n=1 Tax=Cellulomonas fulva TaxID=2835530 RepID=A0ABS5TWM0_9CELL|nr:DUF6049 family protein [Cellulomonas fulva]MBT0993504.1 hypothetical protein [Cellulomonas fulva]
MSAGVPRRFLSAILVGLAGLVVLVVGPGPARADDPPADGGVDAAVDVRIVSISPQVLEPGQDLTVTVALTNTTGRTVDDVDAVLRINRFRMSTRTEVAAWADQGETTDATVWQDLEDPLKPGSRQTVRLEVPAAQVGLTDLPGLWGPRGMVIEARSPEGSLGLTRSYVLWNPDEVVPRVPVAAVLPVTGPATVVVPPTTSTPEPAPTEEPTSEPTSDPTTDSTADPTTSPTTDPTGGSTDGGSTDGGSTDGPSSDPGATGTPESSAGAAGTGAPGTTAPGAGADSAGTADTAGAAVASLPDLIAPDGTLDLMLRAATADSSVSLAVDPALVAQADAGDAAAQEWAERVRTTATSHDTFTLPWADPDASAVAHADQTGLLDIATRRSGSAAEWARAGTLLWTPGDEAADGVTLGAVTTTGAAAMVTAPQQVDADAPPEETSSDSVRDLLTGSGTATAIAPDDVLTRLALPDETSSPAAAAQRALAELALVAREPDLPAAVVIAPDRDQAPDRTTLAAMLQAFRNAPWARVTTVARALAEGASASATSAPARSSDDAELSPAAVTSLAGAREDARSFSEVIDDADQYLDAVDASVLAPLAVAWRAQPERRATVVDRTVTRVTASTQGLSFVPMSDLTVIATEGDVRLTVSNDLAVDARAEVLVEPRKACLTAGVADPVDLPASSDTVVNVPLSAHANCDVVVEVRLVGPSGQDVAQPIEFTARVTPTIESVGTVVVGILLALGLVLGIVRTVRRGQSARRGARTVDPDAPRTLPVLGGTPVTDDEPDDESDDDPGDGPGGASSGDGATR